MEPGNIVEYIDRQKIICAAVLEIKKHRLRILTENNREVKLSLGRLSHISEAKISISLGRDKIVLALKETGKRRRELAGQIDIKGLWEILNTEQEWIDLETMTGFCFDDEISPDHESAVIRAFFANRLYFKYQQDRFLPYTKEQVEKFKEQAEKEARKQKLIEKGGQWLKNLLSGKKTLELPHNPEETEQEFITILKSCYLFGKDSPHWPMGKEILARAGTNDPESLFQALVKTGVWDDDENIDLYRYEIPVEFSQKINESAKALIKSGKKSYFNGHKDLTNLRLFTIDGQATLDFDDAISIEKKDDHYVLGVHIADVGHFIEKGSSVDKEAEMRGSSIYMPDCKIPMLPPFFAEDHCSLKINELRPAISTMIRISPAGDIIDYDIIPSIIKVTDQLTYYDANLIAGDNYEISLLYEIAKNFRKLRLERGAVHISLPEINIWVDENKEPVVTRTNRESPGRMLVSEIMIMANWLMARFLMKNEVPAIFRSQPDPRERLFGENGGSLYQNWMQRKYLSRFMLGPLPERHAGLGLDAYVTSTSPIRKYSDLVTQRQIKSIFGLNPSYSKEEIERIINFLKQPMSYISRLQNRRKRYWLLKYLEKRKGQKEEAIVLSRLRNKYLALITEYMIECTIPISSGFNLKPEDIIQVTIQHVNARKDILTVYMG